MRLTLIAALGLASLTAACGGTDNTGDDTQVNCATETRDDDFVVGLEKMGEAQAIDVKLMSADPAPPARDDNTWVDPDQRDERRRGRCAADRRDDQRRRRSCPMHQHGTPIGGRRDGDARRGSVQAVADQHVDAGRVGDDDRRDAPAPTTD